MRRGLASGSLPTVAGLVLFALAVLLTVPEVSATRYIVGGNMGWTTNVNYTIWAKDKHFYNGDWLFFVYDRNQMNILEVNKTDYETCNSDHPLVNWTRGAGRDVVPLNVTRHYYFVSGKGFCYSGMKLAIRVENPPPPPSALPLNEKSSALRSTSYRGQFVLPAVFAIGALLADGVIPNEYGINPKQKLKIGSKIARRLLGKILIDLRNTREEAISVAELKSNQDQNSDMISEKDDAEHHSNFYIKSDDAKRSSTNDILKPKTKNDDVRRSSTTSDIPMDQDDDDDKETKYRLDPKYANVKTPERHVRTRLYFTSESHIHSLMNVLRYCNLDESLQGEESLFCHSALERLYKTKELDYMSYIVLRMFENTEVALEDPKRFRIEMTFSRGADLSPLEKNDSEAASLHQEHTLPIMGPERLQEVGSYLTMETMEKMVRPFAMPAEDFPPSSTPAGFSGYFSKSAAVLERLVNLWPFHKNANSNGK